MSNLQIYTDGAYSSLRNQGGIGIIFVKDGKELRSYNRMFKNVTNNKMELLAVIIALQTVLKNKLASEVTILTDSQYVIGCASKNWKRNKNKKLWAKYDEVKNKLDTENINLNFEWVQGHNGDKFNELVDKLAVEASKEIDF